MKPFAEYKIPFLGLKVGTHHYQFTLKDEFFEAFEYSEISNADIRVELELEKQSTMMVLDFQLEGTVELICDRCGDPVHQAVETNQRLILKLGSENSGTTDDDIIVLGPSESDINVAHYLYEYSHLALPARHVHETEEECNQEVMAALSKYMVQNDNRNEWAALKNLHFEENEPEPFEDYEEE